VAHGRPGEFQIGGKWINSWALIANADYLRQWKVTSIALWSCSTNCDPSLESTLKEITGANIYAASERINFRNRLVSQSPTRRCTTRLRAPFERKTARCWKHFLAAVPSVKFTTVHNATRGSGNFTIGTSLGSGPFTFTAAAQSDNGSGQFKLGQGNSIHGTLSYGSTSLTGYIDYHEKNIDGNTADSEAFYFISGSSWYALIPSDDGNQVYTNQASLPAGRSFWYIGQQAML
jgi:hypothetical protein